MEFYQFPYGADNYGVLVHDAASGETALGGCWRRRGGA